MKVTYNWLKDFLDIKITPQVLADKLTMVGLEVTSLEPAADDWVLEIEVTSNRPDCLSIIGIAREVAAITGEKLKLPRTDKRPTPKTQYRDFSIDIRDKKDCPLYIARVIQKVEVRPSPDWLKQRLELVGCRSVNSIVDITNYVLFEYGEPLHAFDLDKLGGQKIIVRRAKTKETLTAIDGKSRALDTSALVIADKNQAVALAGIMGGLKTEVGAGTKNILLEAAVFDPLIIRRTRQKFGMQSESAYRFERGINLDIVEAASRRAVELIEKVSAGKCILEKKSGVSGRKQSRVTFDLERAGKVLGVNIPALRAKGILSGLGFKLTTKKKSIFLVDIPGHRPDVKIEEDLIEELVRIFGYERIPTTLPAVKPRIITDNTRDPVSRIKNILVGLGLNEVISYSLIARQLSEKLNIETPEPIEILNPLSTEQEILRPLLASSLLGCISHNLNHKQDYINIFEVAKVFSRVTSEPREGLHLAIALCGTKPWLFPQGLIKDEAGILHIKGILETIFIKLGIREYSFRVDNNAANIGIYIAAEQVGFLLMANKDVLGRFQIKNKEVVLAELSLDRLFSQVNLLKKFIPLPLYPGIIRDISLLIKEELKVEEIIQMVKEKGRPWIKQASISDYYQGKQIPAGFKGLTISCLYRADERTLTEAEIKPLHAELTVFIQQKFGAQIR
ncbi:phenylalanine--tRNA ligase subunit beta [bacterium]|nr:MAG: phenylalanine--tRNA ligase subunit beta [bacterium]